jgi:hypothetical protein
MTTPLSGSFFYRLSNLFAAEALQNRVWKVV